MRGLTHCRGLKPATSIVVIAAALAGLATPATAQVQVGVPPSVPLPVVVQPASQPMTRLETFQPEAGAILTAGHEILGAIARGRVFVDVRDVRDTRGNMAGGVSLHIIESQTRDERAFIDIDELPGLLRNLDALLRYTANPTAFRRFEARFTTRGNLSFVAYSNSTGAIEYALQVNKVPLATISNIESPDMLKLRALLEHALQKLNAAGYPTGGGLP
jgi:hypothetical protein